MALTTNLVSYYKLDSNSNDSVWSNNWTGTSISYVAGKISNAASFNGSSSRIVWLAKPSTGSGSFSINLWIKVTTLWSLMSLATYGTNATNKNVFLYIDASSKVNANFYWGWWSVVSSTTLSTGTWYMLTLTYDGTNLRLYVNSSLESTWANLTANIWSTYSYIWVDYTNTSFFYNGLEDELWYWSRTLTLAESQQLYNSGTWLAYPFVTANNSSPFLAFM